jgi:phosphatidylinositol alpha-mannosyltransferase
MRIGIVSEYVRPWPGGISEHVHHEATELSRRGHEVFVIGGPAEPGSPPDPPGVIRLNGAFRFPSNGGLAQMVVGPRVLGLAALFRRLRLDVVHVHAPLDPFLPLFAVLASPVATVGTFHASFQPGPLWTLLFKVLRPLTGHALRRLDARIAVSEEARRSITHYFPAEFEILPNGVDLDRFQPGQESLAPSILFVGRPDPRKGLPLLLKAMEQVVAAVPGAELVIAGGGGTQAFESLLAELSPGARGRVRAVGYVAPEALPALYAGCWAFCSPARGQESQGIVLLEAMASGKPVVAFDIPGYREVVRSGQEGVLVPLDDVGQLAEALIGLLTDQTRRRQLGAAGRERAREFGWTVVSDRLEQLFGEALQARATRA